MSAAHQPGHAVVTRGKSFIVQRDQTFTPFRRAATPNAAQWQRDLRRDRREFIV